MAGWHELGPETIHERRRAWAMGPLKADLLKFPVKEMLIAASGKLAQ